MVTDLADFALSKTRSAAGPGEAAVAAAVAAGDQGAPVMGPADMPDFESYEEALEWKRNYNIERREAVWRQRWDAKIAHGRVTWELEKMEKTNRIAAAREAAHRKQLEDRIKQQSEEVEREYKNRCREVQIQKKLQAWETKENQKIHERMDKRAKADEVRRQTLAVEKQRIFDEEQDTAHERAVIKTRNIELQAKRDQAIAEREAAREAKNRDRAFDVKAEADRELAERRARFPGGPKYTRCVLLLPEKMKTEEDTKLEETRAEHLARKEHERNVAETKRIGQAKAARARDLQRFKGSTEQDLLRGRRSIFECPISCLHERAAAERKRK